MKTFNRSVKPLLISSVLSGVIASTAMAQTTSNTASPTPVNYNYVGVNYTTQNLDDFDCSQDGLMAYGSMDINSGWFAQASVIDVSGDSGCGSRTLSAKGGYRLPFNDMFFAYGNLGIESTSPDVGSSDSGLLLAAGLRGFVMEKLEAQFELSHHTIFDGETTLSGTGAYWFAPNIAGTATLGFGADATTFAVGARYNF